MQKRIFDGKTWKTGSGSMVVTIPNVIVGGMGLESGDPLVITIEQETRKANNFETEEEG